MAKKRANGEGSLRKRSDGRWEGRYTAGHDPETGKAIYKNVLTKTQKECKEKLAAALEQAGKVDAHKTDQYTVGQWAEAWFENYAKPSIRETTAAYYKNYIDKHIVPNIGKIKLNKLTTLDIQKFYNLIGMVVSKKLVSEPAPLGDLIEEIRQGIGLIKSAAQLVLHTGGAAVGDDVVHLPAVLSQVGPCGLVLLLAGQLRRPPGLMVHPVHCASGIQPSAFLLE